ncbi:MAG: phosphotransferase family protein [Firmicutes bacterium]|nr:phosphotransferase family protein [Bacillota bacterium]
MIEVNQIEYTYRIIGTEGNLFVDRKAEYENLKAVEFLNINNETVYFDQISGDKVAKYIEGVILSSLDYKLYLEDVSETLKKLHFSGIKPYNDYGLIQRLDLYESYTQVKSLLYQELKEQWVQIYKIDHEHMPKVLCHNDAQRSNMIVAKDHLYLLDWEYAGANEFYYDIASFGNIRFEDALELLDIYLDRKATRDEQNNVRFYRMYQALQWHQVALRKEMIGLSPILNIDFKSYAVKFLDLANQLYHEIKG